MDIVDPTTLSCAWPLGCQRMAAGYDHDYETGQVRSPLCAYHNVLLGRLTATEWRVVAEWLATADMGFTYAEAKREADRRWHRNHYEQRNADNRRWYAEHSVQKRAHSARYRSR